MLSLKPAIGSEWMSYVLVFCTILFTVYGQLVIKWQVTEAGPLPNAVIDKVLFVLRLLLNPWIISALFAAFLGAVTWIGAMAKLDLSTAYPFMALNFVLVALFASVFFGEPVTVPKVLALVLIIAGLVVGSVA